MSPFANLLLLLFSMNLGLASGAGLYEMRIVIPLWFEKAGAAYRVNAALMQQLDVGRRFWGLVTTMPLTLLTLANLFLAWQSQAPRHDWWLAAALLTLVERVGTFAFFIPTAIRLERSASLPLADASGLAHRWIRASYIRSAFNLLAWLLTLRALTVPM